MGRLGCWLGFSLMAFAMAAMFALIVLPVVDPFRDNATLMSLQAAINCPSGYTFENEFERYYPRPGETVDVATGFCVSPEGERIEQTADEQGRFVLIAIAAFTIPFIVGLFLLIGGVNMMTRNSIRSAVQTGSIPYVTSGPVQSPRSDVSYVTSSVSGSSADTIDPRISAMIRRTTGLDLNELQRQAREEHQVSSVMSSSDWSDNANLSGGSLSERLKQLDDARDQGLISKEEYERVRKAILNDLV